jgi:hypothetical protein
VGQFTLNRKENHGRIRSIHWNRGESSGITFYYHLKKVREMGWLTSARGYPALSKRDEEGKLPVFGNVPPFPKELIIGFILIIALLVGMWYLHHIRWLFF